MSSPDGIREGAVAFDADFDAGTLHLLRARAADCALTAGMPTARADDVMLAVSELAGNTIRHGPGHGRLRIRSAGGLLRCLVSDDGPGSETWPVRQGHGLWVVRAVADQFTVSGGPRGTLVTATFAIAR